MWWKHWGVSSATCEFRCLYVLHCGGSKAEPIAPLEYLSTWRLVFLPTEQVSVPKESGLNPVHLCSNEAKEFLLGLILLTTFSPSLNNSSFFFLSSHPSNLPSFPPFFRHLFPLHPHPLLLLFLSLFSYYFSSPSFFPLQLSFSSVSPGNSLCSAAQVWQWGVRGGRPPGTLRLLWWVALGRWSPFHSQFGSTYKKRIHTLYFTWYLALQI